MKSNVLRTVKIFDICMYIVHRKNLGADGTCAVNVNAFAL